jgi:hypothetical protein
MAFMGALFRKLFSINEYTTRKKFFPVKKSRLSRIRQISIKKWFTIICNDGYVQIEKADIYQQTYDLDPGSSIWGYGHATNHQHKPITHMLVLCTDRSLSHNNSIAMIQSI